SSCKWRSAWASCPAAVALRLTHPCLPLVASQMAAHKPLNHDTIFTELSSFGGLQSPRRECLHCLQGAPENDSMVKQK
ncbi:MAG: hypothetical protein AAGI06_18075, partial [Pseudomonadota bacterium]